MVLAQFGAKDHIKYLNFVLVSNQGVIYFNIHKVLFFFVKMMNWDF